MTFGEKIKEARRNARLSQDELAMKLSVSRSAIAKWESDKGMPDIQNLKSLAAVLNISLDYLLNDGTKLDLTVTREPIDLKQYGKGMKKVLKDRIVREKYPDAEIMTLLAEEKLTAPEHTVNFLTGMLTLLFNVFPFAKALNNLDKEFYLVNSKGRQYLVMITNEFLESRELAEAKNERKFHVGKYKFTNCGPIVNA